MRVRVVGNLHGDEWAHARLGGIASEWSSLRPLENSVYIYRDEEEAITYVSRIRV